MRKTARWAMVGFALAAGLALPAVANSDPKEDAQRHFEAGKALMELEDFNAAAVEFELSVSLFATKNGLFNLANCYKALHRYDSAIWAFTRLEKEFGGQMDDKMLDVVGKTKKTLLSVVGSVSIIPSPTGAAVTIDNQIVTPNALSNPIFLSPGKHVARAVLAGYRDAEKPFMIVAGSKLVVELQLVSLTPTASSPYGPASPVTDNPYGTAPARPSGPAMPVIQPMPQAQPTQPQATYPQSQPTRPHGQPTQPQATYPQAQPIRPQTTAAAPAYPVIVPKPPPKPMDELQAWDTLSAQGKLESQKAAPSKESALVGPPGEAKAEKKKAASAKDSAFVLGLKKVSPVSWTGIGLTLVTGITALACFGTANNSYTEFQNQADLYTSGEISADDPALTKAKEDTLRYGRLATGFGISAALVAAGTVASLIYDVRKAKKKERPVAAWITPDRVVVRF